MLQLVPFTNLFAQSATGQYEQPELMAIAFIPITVAVILFFIGVKLHHSGKPAWIKWTAFIPLAVGLIMGIAPTQKFYGDPLYQDFYGGSWKKGIMHAGGIIVAVIGALGLFVWNRWLNKQKFEDL